MSSDCRCPTLGVDNFASMPVAEALIHYYLIHEIIAENYCFSHSYIKLKSTLIGDESQLVVQSVSANTDLPKPDRPYCKLRRPRTLVQSRARIMSN